MTDDLTAADPRDLGFDPERLARIPDYFDSYLSSGRLPHMAVLIAREGEIAHFSARGQMAMGEGAAIGPDTIYRIYSMTKPVVSVALMMLFEEGKLQLSDPVAKFIPAFAEMEVWAGGSREAPETVPAERQITIRDLMTHTSGLTYSFLMQHPLDALYRERKIDPFVVHHDLEAFCDAAASLPLLFQPGSSWCYSIATDVIGRVIEVVSGEDLDTFLARRIFDPLRMASTGFWLDGDQMDRLPVCYQRDPVSGATVVADGGGDGTELFARRPRLLSGGGGLLSTVGDYYRFARMLMNGGELDDERLLSPLTVEFMTRNHLPGGRTMSAMGDKTFSETRMDGSGFGLGWAVTTDPVAGMLPGSVGAYSWGGLASTYFWNDPAEDLTVIQMTQLMPSSTYPIRAQLQQLVYASIVS